LNNEIHILPDAVANRIAAGEVVSRPAAAVKELLENAIDAGADHIRLVFRDGGKSLIMVQDNGKGMSETDARLCFERHATSKIRDPDDIFCITTKGFRGEALASIAAIAKVELKTRRKEEPAGTFVRIEGSEPVSQEPCSMNPGTVISIKSLFYNVPARRKFLKNDYTETKHIIDEFERVALAHPGLRFEMLNGDNVIHKLEPGNLRKRIVEMYGAAYNDRLVPVEESTDVVRVSGFILKPEFARKTAGEQFFFANNRFIRSPFLKHAVDSAFEGMIQKDLKPGFFIFLDVEPTEIDINIHPSKTEVKFSDERIIYHILQSSVKKALGKFNIAPAMDFDRDTAFDLPYSKELSELKQPSVGFNPDYNPFHQEEKPAKGSGTGSVPGWKPQERTEREQHNAENWKSLYEVPSFDSFETGGDQAFTFPSAVDFKAPSFQWLQTYIVTTLKSGLVVVDQHRAHLRIVYERLRAAVGSQQSATQQEMFPRVFEYTPADFEVLKELLPVIRELGFDAEPFGASSMVLRGIPAGSQDTDFAVVFDEMIEARKLNREDMQQFREVMLRKLAAGMALKRGVRMNTAEMETLLADLFSTSNPNVTPDGKPILATLTSAFLKEKFKL